MIKLLFIIIPTIIAILGIRFMYQAADYWLQVIGPAQQDIDLLPIPAYPDIEVKLFYPTEFSTGGENYLLEAEINSHDSFDTTSGQLEISLDTCDYVRVDVPFQVLKFDSNASARQTATFELETRNISAPQTCNIAIVFIITQGTTTDSVTKQLNTPVDVTQRHLIAVAKVLAGFLLSALGILGGIGGLIT